MNSVEIADAVAELAAQPFDPADFPFAFLTAFGNKSTTIKRLKKGDTNKSDLDRGILQHNNIHIAVCAQGKASETLIALKQSPATTKAKAKFILATDGAECQAEDLNSGELLICDYADFADHFGFFLPLAGITTVRQIRESAFDIKATGRLNKLYIQLIKDNPAWGTADRRHQMNHFMARLIFCFFAEDTGIFNGANLFTTTIDQMSARNAADTHQIISQLFRSMNTKADTRKQAGIPSWANKFPYVNGGLFAGSMDTPRFSKTTRGHLFHIGQLNWQQINPDIFGSMIQAVADEEERGQLGMHYTSVPNILKVLNPLFLDELRAQLAAAAHNPRKLLNLRKRMANIRVFDPACGSGNFLVIAYKEMRAIEAEINQRRGEQDRKTTIALTNFRGIELRHFAAEIARLALIIAEYQCDVSYRGQRQALADLLPLDECNWITCGNALRLDWQSLCPPAGAEVKHRTEDLLHPPTQQAQVNFQNAGGETYICGNPPYKGSQWQSKEQKADLQGVFAGRTKNWKSLDYVAGWFMKAADYGKRTNAAAAFVSTNSICQGRQVETLWQLIFETGNEIQFAHTSFKWANLASHNAGVTVVIVGITAKDGPVRRLYFTDSKNGAAVREVANINAYLISGPNVMVRPATKPLNALSEMTFGNMPRDGGNLLLSAAELDSLDLDERQKSRFIRKMLGSAEFIRGLSRYCLWIEDDHLEEARAIPAIRDRIERVRQMRLASRDKGANEMAARPHQMREMNRADKWTIVIPAVSSENRAFLPVGLVTKGTILSNRNFALYDAPLWNMALLASRLHWVWVATVCGKLETRFNYSSTLGWNTFPVPVLTEKNREDLTLSAEDILLAREAHFPKTIADLYAPDAMPEDLRRAHARNDETLERIFIGRRFKNDTERLEKLFEMYTEMTTEIAPK